MDYYSFTDPGEMESWVGHVGWRIADSLPTSGHLSTTDRAHRESPSAREKCPNHWAMPPTLNLHRTEEADRGTFWWSFEQTRRINFRWRVNIRFWWLATVHSRSGSDKRWSN